MNDKLILVIFMHKGFHLDAMHAKNHSISLKKIDKENSVHKWNVLEHKQVLDQGTFLHMMGNTTWE